MQELSEITEAAMNLSVDERTILVNRLTESLVQPDPDVEAAWLKEVERRLDDVRNGRVELIDGEEGLVRVRQALRR